MKILKFIALTLMMAVSAMAQVSITQPTGNNYTDNSILVRDGTANKVKNAPLLKYTTSAAPGAPDRTLLLGDNTGDTKLHIIGSNSAVANSFNFDLQNGGGTTAQAFILEWDLTNWNLNFWSTLTSDYETSFHINPATNVTTFDNGLSAPVLTSTVATGTPPLVVSSTTLVPNLHAATADSSGAAAFSGLTSGTNTGAAMVVGTGGTLGVSGSGTIAATSVPVGGISGLGTGVGTALAVNVGSAGAPVVFNGALGTPSSGTVTNLTGTASININGTVGANTPASGTFTTGVFGSTTSLLLGTAGSAVGNIGFRNATSGTATLAPPAGALGTYTVTLPNAASTLAIFPQQMTFTGPTAARTVTFPDANFTVARTDNANTFTGTQTITTQTGTSSLTGAAGNMTITAGTGNSRTMALQTTTSGGTATTFLTGDATQNTTLAGNLTLGASTSTITGAAGNMTIVAGTGNSRTMALQTTTSGGTATTALSLNATQDATVAGNLTVSGGTITGGASTLINGGAGNMQITAGTGASRQMTLRTTTSGSTATTALTLGSDQSALIAGPAATNGAAISSSTALNLPAATTALSSLRLAHGAAPTSPVNGDMWTTTSGLNVRVNGSTQLLGTSTPAGSDTYVQFNDGGSFGGDAGMTYNKTTDSLTLVGTITTGSGASTAGALVLTQGTTQSTGTTNITIQAPAAVTSYIRTLPAAVGSTGLVLETVSGSVQTESLVTALPANFTITAPTGAATDIAGYMGMPQNSQSTAYTTVRADAGKHILHPTADNNARTITIDSNANVAYPIGTVITIVNQINTVTIAITSDTLTWFAGSGTGSTGSRSLAAGGVATLLKIGATSWIISGPGVS